MKLLLLSTVLARAARASPFLDHLVASFTDGSSRMRRADNTTVFTHKEDNSTSVYDPLGKLDIARKDGSFGTVFENGTFVIHFPHGWSLKSHGNGTRVVFQPEGGNGTSDLGNGAGYTRSVTLTVDEMAGAETNAALGVLGTRGRRLKSSYWSNPLNNFQVCGNYAGPSWCANSWTYECAGTAKLGDNAEYPICKTPSGESNCAENVAAWQYQSTTSCVDACSKTHDSCCGTDRYQCNQDYFECLDECPQSAYDAGGRCEWWKPTSYAGVLAVNMKGYSVGTSIQPQDVIQILSDTFDNNYVGMCCGTLC